MSFCEDCKWFELRGPSLVWHCMVNQDMMQETKCPRFCLKRLPARIMETAGFKRLDVYFKEFEELKK